MNNRNTKIKSHNNNSQVSNNTQLRYLNDQLLYCTQELALAEQNSNLSRFILNEISTRFTSNQLRVLKGVFESKYAGLRLCLANKGIIRALSLATTDIICEQDDEWLKQKGIHDIVYSLRAIFSHPCPQNRRTGDQAALYNAYPGLKFINHAYRLGVKDDKVYFSIEPKKINPLFITIKTLAAQQIVNNETVREFIIQEVRENNELQQLEIHNMHVLNAAVEFSEGAIEQQLLTEHTDWSSDTISFDSELQGIFGLTEIDPSSRNEMQSNYWKSDITDYFQNIIKLKQAELKQEQIKRKIISLTNKKNLLQEQVSTSQLGLFSNYENNAVTLPQNTQEQTTNNSPKNSKQ